jgi:DnaJ-domain-containing protein 1
MPLVARVVEMLLAAFPALELDLEFEIRGSAPRPEPEPKRTPAANPETDPVLARCYAELGVPYGTELRQVRRAWRGLMRVHHPDVQGGDAERERAGTEKVKKLNRAFEEIGRRLRGGKGGRSNA